MKQNTNLQSENLDNTLLEEPEIVDLILSHIDNKTTDLGDEIWREPVSNYMSEERFQAELALMRRLPVPFCLSAMLPEKGSYVARTAAGTPLLVTRDSTGTVRAFRNACRHRGMPVAQGNGCKKSFTCPYHAWTYGLDGKLRNIPQQGFPGLDAEDYGLSEVRAKEKGGIVYVIQEGDEGWESLDVIPDLFSPDQEFVNQTEYVDNTNWKLFSESAMEGYHIQSLHKETFYPYGFHNLNVVENFGMNSRLIFPFRRINRLRDLDRQDRRLNGLVTIVYQLFPNTTVSVLSKHTALVVLEPVAPDQTRYLIYRVNNVNPDGEKYSDEEVQRDIEFVNETGLDEDREAAVAIQAGLASNANTHLTFGRYEKAIVHFHQSLSHYLDGKG